MWNLGNHLLSEPQAFHLLYGDKNATLIKLYLKFSEMADVKYLFTGRQLRFYPGSAQFTSSHIPWRCGRTFGEAFNRGLFTFGLLVPVGDVTWQTSTLPVPISHSSLAFFISHCSRLSLPIFLLWYIFTHIFTALKVTCRFWGCPEQVNGQLKWSLSILWRGSFIWS